MTSSKLFKMSKSGSLISLWKTSSKGSAFESRNPAACRTPMSSSKLLLLSLLIVLIIYNDKTTTTMIYMTGLRVVFGGQWYKLIFKTSKSAS